MNRLTLFNQSLLVEAITLISVPTISFADTDDTRILRGRVIDQDGEPLANAHVGMRPSSDSVNDFPHAATDQTGQFAIEGLPALRKPSRRDRPPTTWSYLWISHPRLATTRFAYPAGAESVEVMLKPPAIVRGRVVDTVTDQPAAEAEVFARGIDGVQHRATTDEDGTYELMTNSGYYEIWAEMPNRVPQAIRVPPYLVSGKTFPAEIEIPMVRGGFINGWIDDFEDASERFRERLHVRHGGPAGGAAKPVPVDPQGRFRLHVAPGRNFVSLGNGQTAPAYVDVADGGEANVVLRAGHTAYEERQQDPVVKFGQEEKRSQMKTFARRVSEEY